MEDITEQYNAVRQKQLSKTELARINRQKSIRFKAALFLLIGFFSWIIILHGLGIYFFTKGFLLTRLILNERSHCSNPPIDLPNGRQGLGTNVNGCWHPKSFDKAVIIVIDALRYDFTVPTNDEPSVQYRNALQFLHQTATADPATSFLLPFIADPPTTTLQRLKGLTTGTLPTFIDAGSNFAGTSIEEDNLIAQLRQADKNIVHFGDDTWHALFPGQFVSNLTRAYDSFNVWDLHTVDDGVTEHLIPLLAEDRNSEWDVIIGHYLGLDHAGHRYGPNHPATRAKLLQMDQVLRDIVDRLDENTLLVVMGDHGMDVKGDHGGESDDEVEAALWMYSRKGIFGHREANVLPPRTAKERFVNQIDLVPTLSLLLGLPIPFNNLGSPITEAFIGSKAPRWDNLATVNALSASQILRYETAYSAARGLDPITFATARNVYKQGLQALEGRSRDVQTAFEDFRTYQLETLRICRSLWARFDVPSMIVGIAILTLALLTLLLFVIQRGSAGSVSAPLYLGHMSLGALICACGFLLFEKIHSRTATIDFALQGIAFGSLLGFFIAFTRLFSLCSSICPVSIWTLMAVVFTIGQSLGFASNSYTIWEDEILIFILGTFALASAAASFRQKNRNGNISALKQSAVFVLLTRLSSFSKLCREEQMPYCRSTYYASSTSSTSAPWQLVVPVLTTLILPFIIRSYYKRTGSFEGVAKPFIIFGLLFVLSCIAAFWYLDAADDNDWFLSSNKTKLKLIKITLARLIFGISLIVGPTMFFKSQPCINIRIAEASKDIKDQDHDNEDKIQRPRAVQLFGAGNAHGSLYTQAVLSLSFGLLLLQKPMGNGALAVLIVQILALAEILFENRLQGSSIGPIILAALGNYHFFKTGHQATLASIQWDSAFIPLTSITYPFSPLLVVANTYAAQIMTACAVPVLVLWRRPARKPHLLSDVARALAIFVIYHATINLATTIWAGYLRRHLMLYRIFSPRFMTGAAALLIIDIICVFLSLGLFWRNTVAVADIFGWT